MTDANGLAVVPAPTPEPPAELVLDRLSSLMSVEIEERLTLELALRGVAADVERAAVLLDEIVAGGSGDVRAIRDLLRAAARRVAESLD